MVIVMYTLVMVVMFPGLLYDVVVVRGVGVGGVGDGGGDENISWW